MTILQQNTLAAAKKNNFTYLEKNKHRYSEEDLNVRDNVGNTPIYYAVQLSHYETVETLLKLGAEVNSKNEFGNTPLHQALMIGNGTNNQDIINLLINFRADLKALNDFKQTPVFFASKRLAKELGLQKLTASIVNYNQIAENKFVLDDKLQNKLKELKDKYNQRRRSQIYDQQNDQLKSMNTSQNNISNLHSRNNSKQYIIQNSAQKQHLNRDFSKLQGKLQNLKQKLKIRLTNNNNNDLTVNVDNQFRKAPDSKFTSPSTTITRSRQTSINKQDKSQVSNFNINQQSLNSVKKLPYLTRQNTSKDSYKQGQQKKQNYSNNNKSMQEKQLLFMKQQFVENEYGDSSYQMNEMKCERKESFRGLYAAPVKKFKINQQLKSMNSSINVSQL
eukprot:403341903